MTPIETLRDLIVAAATPVATRVSPIRTYQGQDYPYAILVETSEQPQNSLSGYAGLDLCEVQVEVWDKTFQGADDGARACRTAIEAAGYVCTGRVGDFFDGQLDPGSFRIGYTFQVWQ